MKNRVPCRLAPRIFGVPFAAMMIGAIFSAERVAGQQAAPPVQFGFEQPDFTPGNLHGQGGWTVERGTASVTGDEGERHVRIEPTDP